MALTREFKETIKARIDRDPVFREEMLKEGVECLLSGDVEVGKGSSARLHQCHHRLRGAGWPDREVAQEPHAHVRPTGNPQARNLFEVIGRLQECEGLHLKVQAVR